MLNIKVEKRQKHDGSLGLFSKGFIKYGESLWKLDTDAETYDLSEVEKLSDFEKHHGYQFGDKFIVTDDDSEYMNHSCDPTAWWKSDTVMIARKDIFPNEEVTYDYVTSGVYPEWTAEWECHCGSINCRHKISSKDALDSKWQDENRGHLPKWVEEYLRLNF